MSKQVRQGTLIWDSCKVEWSYERFKDALTFIIDPHFKLTVSNDTESIEWPYVTVDVEELKGITDFTELPKELYQSVLDNCILKLNEKEPEITRLNPYGN